LPLLKDGFGLLRLENYADGHGGDGLCRQCRNDSTGRGDHGHLAADQIGGQRRQAIVLIVAPVYRISDKPVPAKRKGKPARKAG
jgi:hypothetical protein